MIKIRKSKIFSKDYRDFWKSKVVQCSGNVLYNKIGNNTQGCQRSGNVSFNEFPKLSIQFNIGTFVALILDS